MAYATRIYKQKMHFFLMSVTSNTISYAILYHITKKDRNPEKTKVVR